MRVSEKVVRQEEEKQGVAGKGEDLCHVNAYNRSPSWARSPNKDQ